MPKRNIVISSILSLSLSFDSYTVFLEHCTIFALIFFFSSTIMVCSRHECIHICVVLNAQHFYGVHVLYIRSIIYLHYIPAMYQYCIYITIYIFFICTCISREIIEIRFGGCCCQI